VSIGGRYEERKKENLHASSWLFAKTTRVDVAPGLCMQTNIREAFIYFKFHQNRLRVSALMWGVENRHLPLTWPIAYTTACATEQAVIRKQQRNMFRN